MRTLESDLTKDEKKRDAIDIGIKESLKIAEF